MSQSLIIYFSRAGENYTDGEVKFLEKGNTEVVAEKIALINGGHLFKVEMCTPYSEDYNLCIEEVKADKLAKREVELVRYLDDIDGYEKIYVGYPNYWGTMPMAMFSLLSRYSWEGKDIYPFCTHEGSRLGTSVNDLQIVCKGACIHEALVLQGSKVMGSDAQIRDWVSLSDA